MALSGELQDKYFQLKRRLELMGSVAVAFSAGVDSTLLLAVAYEALGDRAVAFTAISPANPQRETDEATRFCADRGIRHIAFTINELEIEGFAHNPTDRCYRCKLHLFGEIARRASSEGLQHVAEGSNVDDLGDYRPGRKALEELGVESPLLDCGLTKQDVRDLSRELDLPTWEKPSLACLYSRFAYGDLITEEKLRMVDAAEQLLYDRGFRTVRVRVAGIDGNLARIEVAPGDISHLVEQPLRDEVTRDLRSLGFAYVTVDLQGYRTGSMNETL